MDISQLYPIYLDDIIVITLDLGSASVSCNNNDTYRDITITYSITYVRTYILAYIHTYVHTYMHTYIHICFILSYTGSAPVEPNPSYQVLTTDQVEMAAYQELSSHSGRADVSKQKPAGSVDYYEDIINDQNVPMTDNPSYAVP